MACRNARLLVVDDEPRICRSCVRILSKVGYRVDFAVDGVAALKELENDDYDCLIVDLKMGRLGGMEVLRRVKARRPAIKVIVITGYSSVPSAVEVMKLGAYDYLPKPFTPEELRAVVGQALAEKMLETENRRLQKEMGSGPVLTHQLIGGSPQMKKVVKMVAKVAPTESTVVVCGESGTGKELVARAVHANSLRAGKVFFAVDCGALSKNLLESELFGHRKGAFTGAYKDKEGIFQRADGGTVFLDEIGNIDLDVQGKLLRFLETREFLPLGAARPVKVDVRLIFASNRNLKELVERGLFREDFYYRIFVYPIELPPLRERKEDILPIAYHFLSLFSRKLGREIKGFTDDAIRQMNAFQWPGNVRQLRNVIERATILCEGEQIRARDLSLSDESRDLEHLIDYVPETNAALKQVKKQIRRKAVAKVEKSFLLNALSKADWNVTRAAARVGLQRSNFQAMMKKHGITRPRSR